MLDDHVKVMLLNPVFQAFKLAHDFVLQPMKSYESPWCWKATLHRIHGGHSGFGVYSNGSMSADTSTQPVISEKDETHKNCKVQCFWDISAKKNKQVM